MSGNDVARRSSTGLIEVPLGTEAHRYAKGFAAEQSNPHKGKQVYLNTLAVYAVYRYLDWLNIETDLKQSDSWNPIVRRQQNTIDLFLPGIGRLDCCPVLPKQTALVLPSEAIQEDRIGYIAVQFDEQLDRVTLLGFIGTLNLVELSKQVPIDELQSLEYLSSYLERRKLEFPSEIVDVGLWFASTFDQSFPTPTEWVPLPVPALESVARRSSGEELDAIAWEMWRTKKIEIPSTARAAYRSIQIGRLSLRLYAVTWMLTKSEVERWTLLLVITVALGVRSLEPIKLQLGDRTKILTERMIEPGKQSYQVLQVAGTLNEEFILSISSVATAEQQSCLFRLSAEEGL